MIRNSSRGQILPIVLACLLLLLIVIASLVNWIQNDTNWAVKNQKTIAAVNLAETGLDRAKWYLQSSTWTWAAAAAGTTLAGYHFDKTYSDVSGGTYRIRFGSGTVNGTATVTITAEARDALNRETRALQTVVKNQSIYSAMMSGGTVTWAKGLAVFWGPIMSQGNIQLMDDFVAGWYYPRKFAKGTVIGTAANPRDVNGLTPPNTDNVEWWSEYNGVPALPQFDFSALRSSAAATGTLNVYGCKNSTTNSLTGAGPGTWDLNGSCNGSAPHTIHFGDSTSYVKNNLDPTQNYVWYWDGDLELDGQFNGSSPYSPTGHSTGLRGTVIVRGNLTINSPGDLVYTGHVPATAWMDEQKLTASANDTGAPNEYPADTGLHANSSTYNFGTDSSCIPITGCGEKTTVGIRGFTYIGGNLTIISYMDFNGAVWINGNVTASGGSNTAYCGILYDDTLQVPTLNVVLQSTSWNEVTPSPSAWP